MDWYVIDALEDAYERTKRCLFEPFDLRKWVKLAIILLFVSGSSGYGGNPFNSFSNLNVDSVYGPSYNNDYIADQNILDSINREVTYSFDILSVSIIALILVLIFIFIYISSLMEFVLVESLVSNKINFLEYIRRFFGKGIQLFLIRIASFLLSLLVLAVFILPFIFIFGMTLGDHFWLSFIGGMIGLLFIFIIFAIIASVLGSFISISVPVAIYRDIGMVSAILKVLGKFRLDWQQIIVYWVGRAVLGVIVGIATFVVLMLTLLLVIVPFLILDIILYFLFSLILSGLEWLFLTFFILLEVIILIIVMALVSMPFGVFLKYHMLTFVEKWYPETDIPFEQGIDLKEEKLTSLV